MKVCCASCHWNLYQSLFSHHWMAYSWPLCLPPAPLVGRARLCGGPVHSGGVSVSLWREWDVGRTRRSSGRSWRKRTLLIHSQSSEEGRGGEGRGGKGV